METATFEFPVRWGVLLVPPAMFVVFAAIRFLGACAKAITSEDRKAVFREYVMEMGFVALVALALVVLLIPGVLFFKYFAVRAGG